MGSSLLWHGNRRYAVSYTHLDVYKRQHTDCMGIVSIRSVHKELVAGNLRVVEIKGMPMLREFNFVQLQGQEGGLSQVFMRFAGHHSKSL